MKPISQYADRETLLALKTEMQWVEVAALEARIPVLYWLMELRRCNLVFHAQPTQDNAGQAITARGRLLEANHHYHPILAELRRLKREFGAMRLQPKDIEA